MTTAPDHARMSPLAVAATLFLVAVFAGDQLSRKVILEQLTPLWSGALAYSIAGAVLWAHALWTGVDYKPASSASWRAHGLSGLLFLAVNAVGLFGVQQTLASRAGVFIFTYPLFVAVFGAFGARGERLRLPAVAGMGLAFFGVVVVLRDRMAGTGATLFGDGLILLSAALLGLLIVHVRNVSRDTSASQAILWQMTLSLPGFFLLASLLEPSPTALDSRPAWALLYQALAINALGFLGRAMLIARYSANTVSSFFFLTPALAVLFAWALLGDPLTMGMVLGGLVVGIGVLVVYQTNERAPATPPSEASP